MLLVLGAQAKSKEKFGLKVMGSWDDSVAASVASGKCSCSVSLSVRPADGILKVQAPGALRG